MKRCVVLLACLFGLVCLPACGESLAEGEEETIEASESSVEAFSSAEIGEEIGEIEETEATEESEEEAGNWFITDVNGIPVVVDGRLALSEFSAEDFMTEEGTGRIRCQSRSTLTGVDVSSHQGEIDWAAVAEDDIDFAMLRIGYRGYTQGGLNVDETFDQNYDGAKENGLEVGAYFFSQAITVREAEVEADFVLSLLNGRPLDLPVVYDWEEVAEGSARTDGLSGQTVTECALAFCRRIEAAGYQAAFYCNEYAGYLIYDFSQLQDVTVWYAEYGSWPGFAYSFDMWQYSRTGHVAGIDGNVDLDLWFLP